MLNINSDDDHHIVGSSAHETEGGRVLKHGDAFLVVDRLGEIQPTGRGEQGIYYRGTRYVSKLRFRFGKRHPMLLCSSVLENNLLLAVDLANPEMLADGGVIPHGTIHLARRALLRDGAYLERVLLCNFGHTAARFTLRIEIEADFADIFEVRGTRRAAHGKRLPPELGESSLALCYEGLDSRLRVTELTFSRRPDSIEPGEVMFDVSLRPHEELVIDVSAVFRLGAGDARVAPDYDVAARGAALQLHTEESSQTFLRTSNRHFNHWLDRARADLRMLTTQTPRGPYPYAGVPWFSTVFGRDGIWTALQMLWVDPSLAAGVLAFLSAHQATEQDAEADAEPGKIVHEMRDGEMATLREVPFGRYYGSIDSTPLYVMLAAAYYESTGDAELIRRIWPNLVKAMAWITEHGDLDGDGFIEYGRRSSNGLVQQGWKDSNDSVFHADGEAAEGPIALCEVQGYAFAARRGMARLAAMLGEHALAAHWEGSAIELQQRFDAAFWCEELSTYALALDGAKRACRVKTSNAGHCLYTGIALPARVAALSGQLMSTAMFSGWGVRTLASDERRYNPLSYHNGSIWPHDNAILAEGLALAGRRQDAVVLLEAFFDAASFMDFHRLPELFCGFPRQPGQEPIRYPVACLPQAWASGAAFSLLRSVLGLEIDALNQRVTLRNPILPPCFEALEILRLRVGKEQVELRLVRHPEDVGVTVSNATGSVDVVVIK